MNLRLLTPLFVAIFVTASLTACDGQSPGQQAVAPATQTAPEEGVAAEVTADTPVVVAEVEETQGLPATEDNAEEIRLPVATPAVPAVEKREWRYREGEHYRRMQASQGTSSPPDKIEVAEVFWYGCSHCYNFEPIIDQWLEGIAADVSFVRIPVIWNPTNQVHARIMYTAEALDVLDQVHAEVFRSIHQNGEMLTSDAKIVELFQRAGIDETQFREAYSSFGVTSAVKRAENLTRRYGVKSVPVIVVNGKYATDAPEIRNFDDILSVTNELVERERQDL